MNSSEDNVIFSVYSSAFQGQLLIFWNLKKNEKHVKDETILNKNKTSKEPFCKNRNEHKILGEGLNAVTFGQRQIWVDIRPCN